MQDVPLSKPRFAPASPQGGLSVDEVELPTLGVGRTPFVHVGRQGLGSNIYRVDWVGAGPGAHPETALGVDRLVIAVRGKSRHEVSDELGAFAEAVIEPTVEV